METHPEGMTEALETLRRIYDELPSLDCKGMCWNSCGAIDASLVERAHIAELGVEIPVFTEEWAQAWANDEPVYCPAFSLGAQGEGKPGCRVYDRRPMICRLWGVSDSMPCPYGCKPERTLSDRESFDLLIRSLKAGGHPLMDERLEQNLTAMLDDPEGAAVMADFIRRR